VGGSRAAAAASTAPPDRDESCATAQPAAGAAPHTSKTAGFYICAAQRQLYPGTKKGKGSPYSITERRVPDLIPFLGSQPAGDVNHKPGGRLPLLSARPAFTPATFKKAATSFVAW